MGKHAAPTYLISSCSSSNTRKNRLGNYLLELQLLQDRPYCTILTKLTQKRDSFLPIPDTQKNSFKTDNYFPRISTYFVSFGHLWTPMSKQVPLTGAKFQLASMGMGKTCYHPPAWNQLITPALARVIRNVKQQVFKHMA